MQTSTKRYGGWLKVLRIVARADNGCHSRILVQSAAFLILAMMAQLSVADEFWAIPQVRGKGDDYLFVVDPAKAKQVPHRRLRCMQSLPQYIEEIARAASRVEGRLLLRIDAEIVREVGGERAEKVKVKMVCLTPRSSYPILSKMGNWKDYAESLPEERMPDPFTGNETSDPFGNGTD